ncbi:MAG: transposase [Actinomycetota bacterium]
MGRPSIPPPVMLRAMLCATHDKTSDYETSRRTPVDADRKAAMGVDDDFEGIAATTFSLMRARMIAADADNKLFEKTLHKAVAAGVLRRNLFRRLLFNWTEGFNCRWGGPSTCDNGYEHDLALSKEYFEDCTTWTDLPNAYDDCPTAGVSEVNGKIWVFSFGTYHANHIRRNHWYYGSWDFSGGFSSSSAYSLIGQEVWKQFCPWDSIWCMGSTRSNSLKGGTMNWGKSFLVGWNK